MDYYFLRHDLFSDQKTCLAKVDGSAQEPWGFNHFPDPVEAHWWPIWIFEVLIEGMIESKTYFVKVDRREGPIT